jgi:hypothetical protein
MLLLLLEFFLLAHKVQITSIPSRPFMSFFPFIADVTATYARDVNVCRKKGFVCVCCPVVCGWAYTVYGCATSAPILNGFISSSHSPPPLFTTPPRCYPARPPYRHPHQYAPSTGGQTSGQLRKRETLMTRQHPAQLTVLHHHRFFWGDFYFGEFFF